MIHLGDTTTATGQPTGTTAVTTASSSTLSQPAAMSMFDTVKGCYTPSNVMGMASSGGGQSGQSSITPSMCVPYWIGGAVLVYLLYTVISKR